MAIPSFGTLERTYDALTRKKHNPDFVRDFLTTAGAWDVVKWEDDFLGDLVRGDATAPGAYQNATNGTAAEGLTMVAPTSASAHGAATLKSGTDDDGYADATLGLNWYGQYGALFVAIVKMSAIAGVKVEVGWSDTVAGTDAGLVNVLATPSYTVADGAGWIFDTDDTGNVGWQMFGVKGGTGITKVEPTALGNYAGNNDPIADTYEVFVTALRDHDVRFLRGDMVKRSNGTDLGGKMTMTYDSGWKADGVTGTVALTPWLFIQTRAGAASRTLTIDFLGVYQFRYIDL